MFQDFLGVLFCINMLHVLRMPSLMICSILLGILFFYDIFFVFITPLFTRNGKSVMVEVATGGETGEQLPMVLKVNLSRFENAFYHNVQDDVILLTRSKWP